MKYLVFATNIVMIGLLISSYLSWVVSPLKSNLFSYIGLGFGVILLFNVLYLALWIIIKKWNLAIISFAALLICTKPILTFFPMNLTRKEAPENRIKVMSYNVHAFENENTKEDDNRPLLKYIADVDADIVCLQEYMVSKTGQSLISQRDVNKVLNKYPYRSVTALAFSSKYHIWGLAVFSKYPIEKTHEIVFNSSYNGAAIYTVDINGVKYTVANVHLESNQITPEDKKLYNDFIQNAQNVKLEDVTTNIRSRLGRAYGMRAAQVEKVKSYLHRSSTENLIVCGDFNDTPISYSYKHMREGLSDAYVSNGFGPGITYHQDFFLFRIDYIMHSKNLKAYKTKVDKVKYSDHYPIYTYLSPDN